jgi:phosphocarrier protein HPr
MKEFEYTILDKEGIHARPAGILVKTASMFGSKITAENKGREVDMKGIFGVMSLAAKYGEKITVRAEGSDEDEAIEEIKRVLKENL